MLRHRSWGLVGALLVVSCGSAPVVAEMVAADPTPPAPPPARALPASWTCDGGRGPAVNAVPPNQVPPPVAGQLTEEGAQAKRLWDAEKWREAEIALDRVASGQTGDDEGNKQIAEYHIAIARYRLGRFPEALQSFRLIAKQRNHLKHNETLLWLAKLFDQNPELLKLEDFAAYFAPDVARFNNANQLVLYHSLSYLVGRERLAENKDAEARSLLSAVPADHAYFAAAKKCLALAK